MRPGRKRELVAQLCREWDVSIRRACGVLEFDTSTYHYKARRRDQAGIEARIRDICETRVRYGYRRVHVLLRREGHDINEKRTRRIYSELGRDCQDFRVWAGIMGKKETYYVPTQGAGDPG